VNRNGTVGAYWRDESIRGGKKSLGNIVDRSRSQDIGKVGSKATMNWIRSNP
jgi:hypothetical protein